MFGFDYTNKDTGNLVSNAAHVDLTVQGINDAPVAQLNTYATDASTVDAAIAGGGYLVGNIITNADSVVGTDSDPDHNDVLTMNTLSNATLTIAGNAVALTPISDGNPGTIAQYQFDYQGSMGTITIDANGDLILHEISSDFLQTLLSKNPYIDGSNGLRIVIDGNYIPLTPVFVFPSPNGIEDYHYPYNQDIYNAQGNEYTFTYQGNSVSVFLREDGSIISFAADTKDLFMSLTENQNAVFGFDYTVKDSSGVISNPASVNVTIHGETVLPKAYDDTFTVSEREFDSHVSDPSMLVFGTPMVVFDGNQYFVDVWTGFGVTNIGNMNLVGNVITNLPNGSGVDVDPQGNLLNSQNTLSIHTITNFTLEIAGHAVTLTPLSNPSMPNAVVQYQFVTDPHNTDFFLYTTSSELLPYTYPEQELTGTITVLNNGEVIIDGQMPFDFSTIYSAHTPPHNIFFGLNEGENAVFSFDYTVENGSGLISNTAHSQIIVQGENNAPFLGVSGNFSMSIDDINSSIQSTGHYFVTNLLNGHAIDLDANDSIQVNNFNITSHFLPASYEFTSLSNLSPEDVALYRVTYSGHTMDLEIQKDGDVFFTSSDSNFFLPLLGIQMVPNGLGGYIGNGSSMQTLFFESQFNVIDSHGAVSVTRDLDLNVLGSYSKPYATPDASGILISSAAQAANPFDITGNVLTDGLDDYSQFPSTLKVVEIKELNSNTTYAVPETGLTITVPLYQNVEGSGGFSAIPIPNAFAELTIHQDGSYIVSHPQVQYGIAYSEIYYTIEDIVGTSTALSAAGYTVTYPV